MDENNKRIAKNTLYMYGRMLVTLFVGLLTARGALLAPHTNDPQRSPGLSFIQDYQVTL